MFSTCLSDYTVISDYLKNEQKLWDCLSHLFILYSEKPVWKWTSKGNTGLLQSYCFQHTIEAKITTAVGRYNKKAQTTAFSSKHRIRYFSKKTRKKSGRESKKERKKDLMLADKLMLVQHHGQHTQSSPVTQETTHKLSKQQKVISRLLTGQKCVIASSEKEREFYTIYS